MIGACRRQLSSVLHRLAALFLACTVASSQVAAPAANPKPDDSDTFVVRINVNLVQVDAVVTDSKGKPVTDLKADDFEVLQDGAVQKITNFSYVNEGVKAATPPPAPRKSVPDAAPPPVALKANQVKRVIALVVDDLGLSPSSIAQVRSALKKFVDHEIQPGDVVAVIRTGGGIGALQQFTTDRRLLYASIDRVKFNFNGRVGSFAPINPAPVLDTGQTLTLPNTPAPTALTHPSAGTEDTSMNGIPSASVASLVSDPDDACSLGTGSSVGSLAAVRYVVQGLQDLPGRKALVLFSENMQMFEPPGVIPTRPFVKGMRSGAGESSNSWTCDYSRVRENFRKLTDAAERAAVVIYTVDPRGADPVMFDVADNPLRNAHTMAEASGSNLPNQLGGMSEQYRASQEGLKALAEETGGTFAVLNDMLGAIREAAEDSANYYLIGYHPPPSSFEQKGEFKFHKVEVKLKRPGLKVRSRNGFFGFPGRERSVPALSREEQFARVLVSPFAVNDIHLRMTTLFSHSDKSSLSTLLYIDGKDLTFTLEPDGTTYKAVVEAVAITFDEDGRAIDDTQKIFTLTGNQEARDLGVKNGLILTLQHVTEKPGPYQMRVAVRDAASRKMGAASQFVEVPDLKRKRLAVSGILMRQEETPPAPGTNMTVALDPKGNEAIRIFQPGEKIDWEFQIFNARKGADQKPNVTVETRIFREGSEIVRSEPVPVWFPDNLPPDRLAASGRMRLGPRFVPGDYALQIVVTDNLAKKKNAMAAQSIDFAVASP